ncbi:tRNA (adenosine(37)-N6)-threonylcarbamoyltransferase complex ATPase subunit type 1 TsaE [Prolixibacter bellariivorans]|uniref:tRNA threonylcarbamoyladenosine biosynthesis protein TsaE n=1 Tax=Prolixibacter bellariivorans TaxID=314319 RepID=A0A5M4AZ27_9BACT|nr:tRNA (adenosine(37)-N6)-threonylcarbamoyltransferase complex ATPase subunit type 1 TsaE [Prolixibacter bellariivorans]GET33034.1 tRNA (adenosine(37)-N6)-threonylcarbamoyltransferase complex ATPase subunit type 1 TsaE [Prolixibacter bellariivorans]
MFKAEIHSLEEINHIAQRFIAAHPADRVFAFYGKMGAGKTTFIKALCEEMQVTDYVTSPTFALINEYQTSTDDKIFHFDFYRIKALEEAYDFGYEDYFFSGKHCFIEWPEKIESILPENTVKVYITEMDDGLRTIESKN